MSPVGPVVVLLGQLNPNRCITLKLTSETKQKWTHVASDLLSWKNAHLYNSVILSDILNFWETLSLNLHLYSFYITYIFIIHSLLVYIYANKWLCMLNYFFYFVYCIIEKLRCEIGSIRIEMLKSLWEIYPNIRKTLYVCTYFKIASLTSKKCIWQG